MTLRCSKTKQPFALELERSHAIARPFVGFWHDFQGQVSDVLERSSRLSVQGLEVVVDRSHAQHISDGELLGQPRIGQEALTSTTTLPEISGFAAMAKASSTSSIGST